MFLNVYFKITLTLIFWIMLDVLFVIADIPYIFHYLAALVSLKCL